MSDYFYSLEYFLEEWLDKNIGIGDFGSDTFWGLLDDICNQENL